MEEGLTGKARLILGGSVRVPEDFVIPEPMPGEVVCPDSLVFEFGDYRVRKSVSHSDGEFDLVIGPRRRMSIVKGDETIASEVELGLSNRGGLHQLFIDMSGGMSSEEAAELIHGIASRRKVKMITLTARFVGDMDDAIERIAQTAEAVRWIVPKGFIGVEAWMTSLDQVKRLRKANVNEIKIDIGCARRDIFEKLYPDRDYDALVELLRDSNEFYKRGKLATDVVYGLGESDQDVDIMLERLCRMNVVPVLRTPRPDQMERIERAGIAPETPSTLRAVFLCGLEKSAMKRHGIDPSKFHTGCMSCGACILVPFKDLRGRKSSSSPFPEARRSCISSPASAPRSEGKVSETIRRCPPTEAGGCDRRTTGSHSGRPGSCPRARPPRNGTDCEAPPSNTGRRRPRTPDRIRAHREGSPSRGSPSGAGTSVSDRVGH